MINKNGHEKNTAIYSCANQYTETALLMGIRLEYKKRKYFNYVL